jgi:hypothetical protein
VQFAGIPHERIQKSLRTIGEKLIPVYDR